MNQAGVIKIHSWFTPQLLIASSETMVSGRCQAHPVVERPSSLQPPFNEVVVSSANYQFRFAITFKPCYFTPKVEFAIMFHPY